MKLQLLVIGCCVALAVSKPAEDACAAMRARLLPSLAPSARADAGALRACDADSDGAVDAAELVSCVQRAFGSTAHMDRAEVGERINCFRSIMADTALRGEQRQMIDTEQVRQLGSGSGSVSGLDCVGQNQFAQILDSISDRQLRAANDALIDTRIISLLTGCASSEVQSDDSIYIQLLAVYDQFSQTPGDGEELFFTIWERSQRRQPPLSDEIMNTLNKIAKAYRDGMDWLAMNKITTFLNSPCGFGYDFSSYLVNFMFYFNEGDRENLAKSLASAIDIYDDPIYEEAAKQLQAVIDDIENSNFGRVREGIRKVVVTCVEKAEMTEG